MEAAGSSFPDDVEALKALLSSALKKVDEAEQHAAIERLSVSRDGSPTVSASPVSELPRSLPPIR